MKKTMKAALLCCVIGSMSFFAACGAEEKNIKIDGKEYSKTGLVTVIGSGKSVTITGSGDEGVFIEERNVTLSPYAIGKYQVTQELFKAVMGTNPSYCDSDPVSGETQERRPVECVSWYEAITFCNKLTLLTGGSTEDLVYSVSGIEDWENLAYSDIPTESNADWDAASFDRTKTGYRLPTEAEWEFAARGGDASADAWCYKYAGSYTVDDVAWYEDNSDDETHEVGKKKANALGIYDMSGNVWEWCQDWYSKSISTGDVTDPAGASSGSYRVTRGGNYSDSASDMAVSYRDYASVDGFRLARSL